jgi:hypothetical protein
VNRIIKRNLLALAAVSLVSATSAHAIPITHQFNVGIGLLGLGVARKRTKK